MRHKTALLTIHRVGIIQNQTGRKKYLVRLKPSQSNFETSNLFVTLKKTKPRIHQFTKCCKMFLKAFKMKKQGL